MPVENSLQGEESEGRGLVAAPDQQGSQLRATCAHLDLLVERMLRPLAQAQQVQSKQIAQMTEVARKLQHQQQQTTSELTMAMQTLHEQHETWTQIFTERVDP